MINLWLREQDRHLLLDLFSINLHPCGDHILTGMLDNTGFLAKARKRFVLGKERIWKVKDTDQEHHFVEITNSSAYLNGLVLTPYSLVDVKCHLKTKPVNETTMYERVELMGSGNFVQQVFCTYYNSPLVIRQNKRDEHFLLYFTGR
jgi:hypothetical protein